MDLFREWDVDGDGEVTKKEFRKAMAVLGFEVSRAVMDEVFDSFDAVGGGRQGAARREVGGGDADASKAQQLRG